MMSPRFGRNHNIIIIEIGKIFQDFVLDDFQDFPAGDLVSQKITQ